MKDRRFERFSDRHRPQRAEAAARPSRGRRRAGRPVISDWAMLRRLSPTVLMRKVGREIGHDNVGLVSAGVAFYAILSLFPAMAAAVSLYGLAADPIELTAQMARLSALVPSEAWAIIYDQLMKIASAPPEGLTLGAVAGIALALWSATKAVTALMAALNIVYAAYETRGMFKRTALALGLTAGAVLFLVIAVLLVVGLPAAFGIIGLDETIEALLSLLRWPLIAGALLLGLATLYYFAPNRPMTWRWLSPGAVLATLLFLAGSVAFSQYVAHFGNYNEIYGSVGAVVALLMWLYLTAYFVLLGAELDAELDKECAEAAKQGPPPAETAPAAAE